MTQEEKNKIREIITTDKNKEIMTQKEFIELSEKEVLSLNGHSSDENVTEAWRGGYIYLREKLREFYENMYQDEFFEKIETILEGEINEFNDEFS